MRNFPSRSTGWINDRFQIATLRNWILLNNWCTLKNCWHFSHISDWPSKDSWMSPFHQEGIISYWYIGNANEKLSSTWGEGDWTNIFLLSISNIISPPEAEIYCTEDLCKLICLARWTGATNSHKSGLQWTGDWNSSLFMRRWHVYSLHFSSSTFVNFHFDNIK